MRTLSICSGVLLVLLAWTAQAEMLTIVPDLVQSSDVVENELRVNMGRATTSIEGNGQALIIGYESDEPISIFMVPLQSDGSYVPMDFMHFTLPKSTGGSVRIDLTVSPGWQPTDTKYLLNLLTHTENAHAGFTQIEFEPTTLMKTLMTGVRHFFTVEPYTPSSYHALRGYRVYGHSITVILGVLLLLIVVAMFIVFKREQRTQKIFIVMLIICLVYGLRMSIDLTRFTSEHLGEYLHGTYDEAGSAHDIGKSIEVIANASPSPTRVAVCRDGTNYKEKIVRYMAYPIPVSETVTGATLALIMDRNNWSTETTIDEKGSHTILHCGAIHHRAEKLHDFADGSTLFLLQ